MAPQMIIHYFIGSMHHILLILQPYQQLRELGSQDVTRLSQASRISANERSIVTRNTHLAHGYVAAPILNTWTPLSEGHTPLRKATED